MKGVGKGWGESDKTREARGKEIKIPSSSNDAVIISSSSTLFSAASFISSSETASSSVTTLFPELSREGTVENSNVC